MDLQDILAQFKAQNLGLGLNLNYLEEGKSAWESLNWGKIDDREIAINEHIYYDLASLTKVFTSTLCLLAISQRSLNLQTTVADFLPFLADFKNSQGQNLTVENLLRHGSGLNRKSLDKSRNWPKEEMLDFLTNRQNLSQNEVQKTNYSCENYIYLGFILEKIYGKNLDLLLQNFCAEFTLKEICYCPRERGLLQEQIAKTEKLYSSQKEAKIGFVQDEKARALEGIAGNAGIFATQWGLQQFAYLWLKNDFNLPENLYSKAFTADPNLESSEDGSRFGLTWRLGRNCPLPNMSGFSGPGIFLDFERERALVYTCNFTFPSRSKTKRQNFLTWIKNVGENFAA